MARQRNFKRATNPLQTTKRLMLLMADFKWSIILVLILVILSSLLSIYTTSLWKPIFDEGIIPLINNITDEGIAQFVHYLVLYGISGISYVILQFLYDRIMVTIGNKTLNLIRNKMFNHMQTLPISFFDTHTHGELMSYYTNDVGSVRDLVSDGLTTFISSIISLVGIFIQMIIISPILTIAVIVLFIVMMFLTTYISKHSITNFTRQQNALADLNGYMEEMMGGSKVVKVFTHENIVKKDFVTYNNEAKITNIKANIYAGIMGPISNNLSHINYAVCSIIGAVLVINNTISVGDLVAFLQYTKNFTNPLSQIMQRANIILNAIAGAERIFEVLDEKPEINEGQVVLTHAILKDNQLVETDDLSAPFYWKMPDGKLIEHNGDVKFVDVDFAYRENHTILHNVSFYAKPGQKIAFVGATGAGKTTITNLINRFYDIQKGEIIYDGINVKEINKSSLRSSLAMVLQDTHLFTGTIMDNIRYGNLNATDQQVIDAAKLARADDFIKLLPEGYNTILTQDGSNLSQGQRQLLSIARAAVSNARVLILDEATSSIDTRTEKLIEEGMDNLMANRTVFVIAHRLSTVRNSNAIMVLDNGVIIERGDHDDLLKQHGQYYRLYTGQFDLD